jgi:hypothetical protein
MCFESGKNTKVIIARKDVPCFKIMNVTRLKSGLSDKKFLSFWRYFKYEVGYHYFNKNFPEAAVSYESYTDQGMHSYAGISEIRHYISGTGYVVAVECYIPKGARYMINKSGTQYLSSDMVVVGRIDIKRYTELERKFKPK